ncbi:MAG: ATP-binding cassette domain-containing protein [Bacilli bacterium]
MLELRNIYKDYYVDKKPLRVLKDINLSFPDKGFVSLLGPSGCGKTTLLNLIGGLDQYTSGDIIVEGKSTKDYIDEDWDAYRNHRIGFVFQSYNLITHLTVLENVEMALTLAGIDVKERKLRATKALNSVGLETELNKNINQLSGGQAQRVAIARALVNNPDIILADEPTGALDTKTSIGVLSILKEISQTRLVIMVTHNEYLAQEYSDRIIKMLDGVITEDSAPLNGNDEEIIQGKEKRTSMSFGTAIKTTWKNLRTKRGRTIMTSTAASFGIIGVALVLAVSNGFSGYVSRVEKGTLASYPIGIYADSISIVIPDEIITPEKFPEKEQVLIQDDTKNTSQFIVLKHNVITPEYLEYLYQMESDGIAASVVVNYRAYLNLVGEKPDGSEDGVGIYQMGWTNYDSAFNPVPYGNFHELLGGQEFVNEYYDLIGQNSRYPENKNEGVIIVDQYNRIQKTKLIDLGIIPDNYAGEYIDFSEFIGRKFKVYNNAEYYQEYQSFTVENAFDGTTKEIKTYRGPTNAENEAWFNDPDKGEELKIVGILRVKKEKSLYDLMDSGIGYLKELKDEIIQANENAPICQALENNYTVNKTESEILAELQAAIESEEDNLEELFASNNFLREFFTFYSPFNYDYYYGSGNPVTRRERLMTDYLQMARYLSAPLDGGNYFLNVFEEIIENQLPNIITIEYSLLELTYSRIFSIAIFAKDSDGKKEIIKRLKAWNEGKDEFARINYSDVVSVVTDNIATLVDIIAAVLIVFSSISLVVSSVMIGIITFTSVVERTKEIGILRALGARKKDIKRLFNAETFMIGVFAGAIGIGATIFLSVIINTILNYVYPEAMLGAIALLNPLAGLTLVTINIILTLICGLIPAQLAANKDPVVALRTE